MTGSLSSAKDRGEQKTAMNGVDTYRPKAVLGDWNEKNRAISLEVSAIAKEIGRTSTQVAFNWSLQKPGTTSPIFAVRTQKRLDEISKIDMGFPQRWGSFSQGGSSCIVEHRP